MLKQQPTTLPSTPDDGRAAHRTAFGAIGTLLVQGGLPPEVTGHLKNAHQALLDHVTRAPDPAPPRDGDVPLGETVASSKRRANGEDPDGGEDDGDDEGDDAPTKKGDKPNPLATARRWAKTPTDDDDPEPTAKKKATAASAKAKPRFVGRR